VTYLSIEGFLQSSCRRQAEFVCGRIQNKRLPTISGSSPPEGLRLLHIVQNNAPGITRNSSPKIQKTLPNAFLMRLPSPPAPEIVPRWPTTGLYYSIPGPPLLAPPRRWRPSAHEPGVLLPPDAWQVPPSSDATVAAQDTIPRLPAIEQGGTRKETNLVIRGVILDDSGEKETFWERRTGSCSWERVARTPLPPRTRSLVQGPFWILFVFGYRRRDPRGPNLTRPAKPGQFSQTRRAPGAEPDMPGTHNLTRPWTTTLFRCS